MNNRLKFSASPQSLWLLAGLTAFVVLVILTGPLWRSLLVAALIAYLFNPLICSLQNRLRLSRPMTASLVFLVSLLLLAGTVFGISALVVNQVPEWSIELRQAWAELLLLMERPFTILNFTVQPQIVLDYLERASSNAISSLPEAGGGWLGGLADNLIWSLVILVSLYYFMRDGQKIVPGLIHLVPADYQPTARELANGLDNIWRIFLRAQLIIFLVLGVLILASTSLILWLFRQGWLPLSPFGLVILLIGVYAAIQQVDNLWLRPQYMGHALKLHSGVVVVALLAALTFTGLLGALLIVPVLASLKFMFQYFRGEIPAPTPAAAPQPLAEPEFIAEPRPIVAAQPELEPAAERTEEPLNEPQTIALQEE
ncbi:MAG: AI-2E family transporter [Anaerolineae bacterium]|jgi:predicted PurR-regulated permease PerM|nr:AI-2E family transporter [Anaerolineae bacterium]